jgi:hypothetical protein
MLFALLAPWHTLVVRSPKPEVRQYQKREDAFDSSFALFSAANGLNGRSFRHAIVFFARIRSTSAAQKPRRSSISAIYSHSRDEKKVKLESEFLLMLSLRAQEKKSSRMGPKNYI